MKQKEAALEQGRVQKGPEQQQLTQADHSKINSLVSNLIW